MPLLYAPTTRSLKSAMSTTLTWISSSRASNGMVVDHSYVLLPDITRSAALALSPAAVDSMTSRGTSITS